MDEHVVIGGEYFDVLDGTYELEQLTGTTYRLHPLQPFSIENYFQLLCWLVG